MKEVTYVIPSDNFDLHDYIRQYSGNTKIARLCFISERCPKYQKEANMMIIDELKANSKNTTLYRKIFEKVSDSLGEPYLFDSNWVDSVDKRAQVTLQTLDDDLQNFRNNVVRPKIRTTLNDLGDFSCSRGDFSVALRHFMRTQDYCSSQDHVIELCLNVINVSIELSNFSHVLNYVTKAEQTPNIDQNKIVSGKLKVAAGLAYLEGGKFKLAARKFLYTDIELGDTYGQVISPKDIAIYGGLCALAEFDRGELYRNVINNFPFRSYLETVPQMQTIIQDFYDSNYANCLQSLDILKNDLQLDIHLHDHVNTLYKRVRNKAIVQYFSPYTSIDLLSMAIAFQTNVESLEKELSQLIVENVISARIDSHNKHLYARQSDERILTYEKAFEMGESFQRTSRSLLLRVNLIRNEMTVRPTKEGKDKRKRRKS